MYYIKDECPYRVLIWDGNLSSPSFTGEKLNSKVTPKEIYPKTILYGGYLKGYKFVLLRDL